MRVLWTLLRQHPIALAAALDGIRQRGMRWCGHDTASRRLSRQTVGTRDPRPGDAAIPTVIPTKCRDTTQWPPCSAGQALTSRKQIVWAGRRMPECPYLPGIGEDITPGDVNKMLATGGWAGIMVNQNPFPASSAGRRKEEAMFGRNL